MTLAMAVSSRIRQLLEEHNMTQYQLYKNSGVPQSTISTILHMVDNTPKLVTIAQIAEGFGMGLDEFFACPIFSIDNLEIQ